MTKEMIPGLAKFLASDSRVIAVDGTRLYYIVLPQGATLPATRFMDVTGSSTPTFDTLGPQKMRVQFDFYAATRGEALGLRSVFREVLDGFSGQLPGGIYLTDVSFSTQVGGFENAPDQFRCTDEYYFQFNM